MTTEDKAQLARESFTLGFMMSREGWNAECAVDEHFDGVKPVVGTIESFKEFIDDSWAFQDALEKAFDMLGIGPDDERKDWVVCFTGQAGSEWELFHGTHEEAKWQATCDNRHLNYGRTGFMLVEIGERIDGQAPNSSIGAKDAAKNNQGWQPIETAPSGVDVLVYWPETLNNQGGKTVAMLCQTGHWSLSWLGEGATGDELVGEPTHWKRLDEPKG